MRTAFFTAVAAVFLCALAGIGAAAAQIPEQELKAFADKIYDIHARQAKEEFTDLVHPDCPPPVAARLDHMFSKKWLKDEAHDIRLKEVGDMFDLEKLNFHVAPEAAIEFQTWTQQQGRDNIELVTGFAVARHQDGLRLLPYPCFEPK